MQAAAPAPDEWLYELENQQSQNPFALANAAIARLWLDGVAVPPADAVPPAFADHVRLYALPSPTALVKRPLTRQPSGVVVVDSGAPPYPASANEDALCSSPLQPDAVAVATGGDGPLPSFHHHQMHGCSVEVHSAAASTSVAPDERADATTANGGVSSMLSATVRSAAGGGGGWSSQTLLSDETNTATITAANNNTVATNTSTCAGNEQASGGGGGGPRPDAHARGSSSIAFAARSATAAAPNVVVVPSAATLPPFPLPAASTTAGEAGSASPLANTGFASLLPLVIPAPAVEAATPIAGRGGGNSSNSMGAVVGGRSSSRPVGFGDLAAWLQHVIDALLLMSGATTTTTDAQQQQPAVAAIVSLLTFR